MFQLAKAPLTTAEERHQQMIEIGNAVDATLDGRHGDVARYVIGKTWVDLCDAFGLCPVSEITRLIATLPKRQPVHRA